ncbi:hypothetical protein TNIN_135201 [Trichonephila inaurata madagascariensis]|uniref:Uncharacterized protein n=1 Tax=Trichonephila inaurata madagascariensis TaxID=2747483 RepID=A0A8X7CMU1_9ARAC|nr:hypothetical protein TNIN_135201 [Trichonephila inaurata madagascariensis]
MSRQRVGHWCCMFREGREIMKDEVRSGYPSTSTNENNIAPSDFHLFPALKVALSRHNFRNNDEVEKAIRQFLASQDTGSFRVVSLN